MADKTTTGLTAGTLPLDGTELHYVIQGGNSRKVAGSEIVKIAHNQAWSTITSTPTSLSGYGITDAATSTQGGKADTALQPGAIGSTVQAHGATLDSLEGLSLVSGDVLYATAADTLARLAKGADGQVLKLASGIPAWGTVAGSGDVVGPASSTTDNIALFSDATGKLLKDSGKKISDFGTGDMLAANNGSDFASIPATRNNLGVTPTFGTKAAVRLFAATTAALMMTVLSDDNVLTLRGGGTYFLDASDTTTADNGGTVLVDAAGRRWKTAADYAVDASIFGVTADGTTNDSAAFGKAFAAIGAGRLKAPAGIIRCNIVVPDNIVIECAGRYRTEFRAYSSASPIIEFGDSGTDAYYIGLKDCTINGETTAVEGVRYGRSTASRTVTYGSLQNVEIYGCVDNIRLENVVGLDLRHVYSHDATNALRVNSDGVVTTVNAKHCQFRQCVTGLNLLGGALYKFDTCVIESNKNTGLLISRNGIGGARQIKFTNCWFENNGYQYTTLATAGAMYIDMASAQATGGAASILTFEDCTINSPTVAGVKVPDVTLNRSVLTTFVRGMFTALDADRLKFSTGTGFAFAKLIDCGTIAAGPSPTLYAAFPALVSAGGGMQGFQYEYSYLGRTYTNKVWPKAADNAAAVSAGLVVGQPYVTATGEFRVVV